MIVNFSEAVLRFLTDTGADFPVFRSFELGIKCAIGGSKMEVNTHNSRGINARASSVD